MSYYLYHIPGKKIGVTCNLNNRVTLQQGYLPNEYEVLEVSDDVDYISEKEIQLQKEYGYRVDRQPYKNLKSKINMKINATEQTSTFPCPVNKLKGQLMDSVGLTWQTGFGQFEINKQTIPWIMANVKVSYYDEQRSFIYNKAFYEAFLNPVHNPDVTPKCTKKPLKMLENIRQWAADRGLYDKADVKTQLIKLQEEMGELAKATLENDKPEVIDAIGDMVVVLTNLAHLNNVNIETCIAEAYNVISKRKGKMINGTFVKDE